MHRRMMWALAATLSVSLCLISCARPQERQAVSPGWLTRNADSAPQEGELIDPEVETSELALGSTELSLHVPTSYTPREIEPEERRPHQVASFGSLEYLVDFDVYEIPKSVAPSLSELAHDLAKDLRGGVTEPREYGGREAYTVAGRIAFDGYVYDTITLLAESNNAYVRVVFWLDHDFDLALLRAERMMSTLATKGEDVPAELEVATTEAEADVAETVAENAGEVSEEADAEPTPGLVADAT